MGGCNGDCKMSRSPHPSVRILNAYIETLTVTYTVQMVSTIPYSLMAMLLKMAPMVGQWEEYIFQGQGRG